MRKIINNFYSRRWCWVDVLTSGPHQSTVRYPDGDTGTVETERLEEYPAKDDEGHFAEWRGGDGEWVE